MSEVGLDVSHKKSKKLTEKMAHNADKIVVIGEKNNWPDFLEQIPDVKFWDIEDPDTGEMELHRKVRDQIKVHVEQLIQELK